MKIYKIVQQAQQAQQAQQTQLNKNFLTLQEHLENLENEREGKNGNYSIQGLQYEIRKIKEYIEIIQYLLKNSRDQIEISFYKNEIEKYNNILLQIVPTLEELKLDQMETNSRP